MYASLADARVPLCMPVCQASISLVGSDCVADVLNASPRPFAGNEQIYVSDVGHAPPTIRPYFLVPDVPLLLWDTEPHLVRPYIRLWFLHKV